MSHSLPELPPELLLEILQSGAKPWQRMLTQNIRVTSAQLNEKPMYFFDPEYFKRMDVTMNIEGMSLFCTIPEGHFGTHIRSTRLLATTLIEHIENNANSERTGASTHS